MDISVVIPVYNESENISPLSSELKSVLSGLNKDYEMIFINDGSSDGTLQVLKNIHSENPKVKIIDLNKNFGQTAAISAGFNFAKGKIVITMDGDLQNDPHDIPRLIEEIDKGFGIVCGYRENRKDPVLKIIFSKIGNWLISLFLGLKIRDYGCALKAFRKEVIKDLNLYGEMHRFIPAAASWSGAKIEEINVKHRPRKRGKSKYGSSRVVKVFLDLLVWGFLSQYRPKPI